MQYLDLAAALSRAKERAALSGSENDALLTELLTISAGVDPQGVTHYRPFYVAATFLAQNQSAQTLSSADGVQFTGLAKPIASLLQLQAGYDVSQKLTIPPGFVILLEHKKTFQLQGSRSALPTLRGW